MATYIILNVIFCLTLLLFRPRRGAKPTHAWLFTIIVLLVLTSIFDSVIIACSIVAYDPTKILGFYIGLAPVEDFFYALYAACIVPLIWAKLGENDAKT